MMVVAVGGGESMIHNKQAAAVIHLKPPARVIRFAIPFLKLPALHQPTNPSITQLLSYKTDLNAAGWTRISRAKLLVTDPDGLPIPYAHVTLRWSHVPRQAASAAEGGGGGGDAPQFEPSAVRVRTSGSRSATGTLVSSSPYAPRAAIRLEVVSIEAPRAGSGSSALGPWPWPAEPAGSSDAITDFVWA